MTAWYAARACEVDSSSGQLVIAAGVLAQGGSSAAGASDGKYKLSVELRQLQDSLTSGALIIWICNSRLLLHKVIIMIQSRDQ